MASKKQSCRQLGRERKPGRRQATEQGWGQDRIIAATRALIETLHPHQVTFVMIARKAGVDPALVRYYFSSREELFLAVAENILNTWRATHSPPEGTPAEKLAATLARTVDIARSVRSMQRLMLEECAEGKSPKVRRKILELNSLAVQSYAGLFDPQQPEPLEPMDPLFAHVAIVGMCEFFAAARPMIVPLLPQKLSADQLAERYKRFLIKLVLDGLRPRKRV